MMKIFRILLSDLHFYSKIGVYPQERLIGNEFILNVELSIESSLFKKEDLSTSISYAEVYNIIKEIMKEEWLLLETVALEISERLQDKWPEIIEGKIRVQKIAPPIAGIEGNCGIEYLF
ncbi:MAG: dihydroneopterin aldolase [Muribaculaceae bacterium]|nr:dihydroneopterin aldolase [Muribaculaceae bacterium]